MSPVRILEITSYPPPRAGWGVRVEHVKRRLEEMGHTCTVLNIGKSRLIPSREYVGVGGLFDYCWKVFRYSVRGYLVHMHVNGDSEKGFVLALLAEIIGLCCGRRCVLTFHAGAEQKYFPQHRAPLLTPMYKLLFAIPAAIICNSESVRAAIAGYGVPRRKIVPIPAFSRQYLQYEPTCLPEPIRAFAAAHRPLLTSYVFFRPEFFIESLIEAIGLLVGRHPQIGLVIMGSDAGSEAIRERMAERGLTGSVLLCGDLAHDDFLTLLTTGDIYVRTPKKDGVASSVLEALSLRVPVVASENGTRPAGVVTFEPDNAQDLADTVTRVLHTLDDVRAAIVPPVVADTVADEAELLVRGRVQGT